ncbi:MAG: Eco57I restriction-modification methylase domain-containing protein, partial [Verrucomicrobiota bacterium]
LVESFGKRLAELKQPGYAEAQLRDDFLNPFFRALGWDMENRAGLIQREREVEIESATQIAGGRKRADYLFRTDKRDRFVCEAKKPAEELHARYAFQAKRYAWNKGVFVAVLTDFEEIKIYLVGGKPRIEEPQLGEWKSWQFRQYPLIARELWDLLARDKVAAGSIDAAIESLPKKASGTGKARQAWLIKPDRNRALDSDFLEFLDETRRDLASDLYKNNDHEELIADNKLTEACQRIIDRILFLRICEDRDIDTGERLTSLVDKWRKNTGNDDAGQRARQGLLEPFREEPPADFGTSGIRAPKDSLWRAVVRHFRALDRRPPTHVPFFNGNLFKPHFTESLLVSDEWLAGFIGDLSDDESPYLFNVIDVEILGSVYERFLGNVVRPHGKGITVEPKPEVRKAGGVYYTPRYIVDYIVEQTAGKLLDQISAGDAVKSLKSKPDSQSLVTSSPTLKEFEKKTAALRLLDPACGSGSFLIRAFERVCEHWQKRLTADLRAAVATAADTVSGPEEVDQTLLTQPKAGDAKSALAAWQKKHRPLCWVDDKTGDVHLTVDLKRKILTDNIYGVDLDSAAVEVTQLSLYLKMLENENRTTLKRQRELLADETEIALLPPLQDNIKCGNSLIASDFSMIPEDLVRVHAFDWPVQFQSIIKAGGFDAVIGNPPYGADFDKESEVYIRGKYRALTNSLDSFIMFVEQAGDLLNPNGHFGMIIPSGWVSTPSSKKLRERFAEQFLPTSFVSASV